MMVERRVDTHPQPANAVDAAKILLAVLGDALLVHLGFNQIRVIASGEFLNHILTQLRRESFEYVV
jgi:hypothetical protein